MNKEDWYDHPEFKEIYEDFKNEAHGGAADAEQFKKECGIVAELSFKVDKNNGVLYSGVLRDVDIIDKNGVQTKANYNNYVLADRKHYEERAPRNELEKTEGKKFYEEKVREQIGETDGGKEINTFTKDAKCIKEFGISEELDTKATNFMWKMGSREYASGLEGTVKTYTCEADQGKVYRSIELELLVNNENVTTINGIDRGQVLKDYKQDPDLGYARAVEGELHQGREELPQMKEGVEKQSFAAELKVREDGFGKFLNPSETEKEYYRTQPDKALKYEPLPENKEHIDEIKECRENNLSYSGASIVKVDDPPKTDLSLVTPPPSEIAKRNHEVAEYSTHGGAMSPGFSEKLAHIEENNRSTINTPSAPRPDNEPYPV